MFRIIPPVTVMLIATACSAETLNLSPDETQPDQGCASRAMDPTSCVRVLACIGEDGAWFEGRAFGWDNGTVSGRINTGVTCEGTWSTRYSVGVSQLTCSDGTSIEVLYTNQDNATGTGIGHGQDSKGRAVQSWSGEHVLDYLTPEGEVSPRLICGDTEWLIS